MCQYRLHHSTPIIRTACWRPSGKYNTIKANLGQTIRTYILQLMPSTLFVNQFLIQTTPGSPLIETSLTNHSTPLMLFATKEYGMGQNQSPRSDSIQTIISELDRMNCYSNRSYRYFRTKMTNCDNPCWNNSINFKCCSVQYWINRIYGLFRWSSSMGMNWMVQSPRMI